MTYQKKKIPREVRALRERLQQILQIATDYGLPHEVLMDAGQKHIKKVEETVNEYNNILAEADTLRDKITRQTRMAKDLHDRLRMAVISEHGRDSPAYRRLGGVAKSEIDYSRKNHNEEE